MPAERDTRTLRRVKRLDAALDRLTALVAELVAACPPRPSARDDAEIAALTAALEAHQPEIEEAARWLKKRGAEAEDERRLALARVSMAALPGVLAAIGRMLERPREPLFPEPSPTDSAARRREVLARGFALLETAASGNLQADHMKDYGFPFIPLDAEHFVGALQAVWRLLVVLGREQSARYLEVGCGAGAKLFIAREFFAHVEGIELDPGYVERAEALGNTPQSDWKVEAADALTFPRYGEFDAIYSYVPIRDPELHNEMERRLLAQAKPGAVILAPMLRASVLQSLPRFAPGLFVKGYDGAEMVALLEEAERVGAAAPPPGPRMHRIERRNLLTPLIEALGRAGFAV